MGDYALHKLDISPAGALNEDIMVVSERIMSLEHDLYDARQKRDSLTTKALREYCNSMPGEFNDGDIIYNHGIFYRWYGSELIRIGPQLITI